MACRHHHLLLLRKLFSSSASARSSDLSLQSLVRQNDGRFHSTKAARFADDNFSSVDDRPVVSIADSQLGQPNAGLMFSRMTSSELVRTLLNLELMACGPLVDLGIKLLKSPVATHKLLVEPVNWCVKRSVYSQFCAGENVSEASKTLESLWGLGLRGILDYGLEDAGSNSACDENLRHIIATVEQTRRLPRESVSHACVKITAIAPLALLERLSVLLRWQLRDPENIKLPWKLDVLPLFAPESPRHHLQEAPEALSTEEEADLTLAQERLHQLCRACEQENVPLLVDAEYTAVQPAIDYITYTAALQFNRKNQPPLIHGTVQAYLKDSFSRLELAVREASRREIPFGVKLVRGAYISRETALAKSLNVPLPIHSCIEDTHQCYNNCAAFMLKQVSEGRGSIVLATHNFESGKNAAHKAEELGMRRSDPGLHFAQLKGMADGLSLSLAQAGFQVSKYLPFGPVANVLKYLIRRAEENRGLLGSSDQDRRWIRQELTRRVCG